MNRVPTIGRPWSITVGQLAICLALASCRGEPTGATAADMGRGSLAAALGSDATQFSDWSQPVSLGPPVSAAGSGELDPFISKDGLTLYFACLNCPGSFGGFDIYFSERAGVDSPWGTPENLGATINTAGNESNPALSHNERLLYFTSNRTGGFGRTDLYMSRLRDKLDRLSWGAPENLGSGVNSAFDDRMSAVPFRDETTGVVTLFFSSNRPGAGDDDIYSSMLGANGTYGPAVLVTELSSSSGDRFPEIRRDGLEIFLGSDRPGTHGAVDLWVSTRSSTSDPWSAPTNLGSVVNTSDVDASPGLSFDGRTLYFQSNRPGGSGPCVAPPGTCVFDLWLTTRAKLQHSD